jgi:LPXTG-site transpeptidase (sortase) family protein
MGDPAAHRNGVVNRFGVRWSVVRHRAPGRASIAMLVMIAIGAYAAAVTLVGYGVLPQPSVPTWLPAFGPLVLTRGNPEPQMSPSLPMRVRIPKIGVNSALQALHLDQQGALQAPADYATAGWYADGTVPGEPGPAVIAGHVDSKFGRAVFYRLHELRPGDVIEVQRVTGWFTFRVTDVDRYPKDEFPTARVYGPTPDAQLRLITCGGRFDHSVRSYVDNVVIYATADVNQQVLPQGGRIGG